MTKNSEQTIADDLLVGAHEIAAFIGKLDVRQVYFYQRELGIGHLGSQLIASKTKLRERLASLPQPPRRRKASAAA
jgi:hypothetical protein